jgi:hypothetical protein
LSGRAASCGLGGLGFLLRTLGSVARAAGLRSIHLYRTARFMAADMIA